MARKLRNRVEGIGIEVEGAVIIAVLDRPCNRRSLHYMQLGSLDMCSDVLRCVAIVGSWSSVLW